MNVQSSATPSQARQILPRPMYLAHLRDLSIGLTGDEMTQALECVRSALSEAYVHLPQKTSAFGTNVLRELEVLADMVPYLRSEREFADQIQRVTRRLYDRHTALVLPSPWKQLIAYLPVRLEDCWENNRRKVIVTGTVDSELPDTKLTPGMEITHWNGIPIKNYIERMSWSTEGANPGARIALAVRSLTVRPLGYYLMPDEDWVTLTLWDGATSSNATIPWRVYELRSFERVFSGQMSSGTTDELRVGLDHATSLVNSGIRTLFAASPEAQPNARAFGLSQQEVKEMNPLPDNLSFNVMKVGRETYGYVRIYSFEYQDSTDFLTRFATLCTLLPEKIILDVRANPGGTIPSGEIIMQFFGKAGIQFGGLQFRNTRYMRTLVNKIDFFKEWRMSMNLSFDTGQEFSQALPITKRDEFPEISIPKPKKAVLIIDALSYSTTDFFAAGFRDNLLGPLIGVDLATGAGGANVWSYSLLRDFEQRSGESRMPPMPRDFDFNLSVRRSVRTGDMAGMPLEGLGSEAHFFHRTTSRDLTSRNEDLLAFAAQVLESSF